MGHSVTAASDASGSGARDSDAGTLDDPAGRRAELLVERRVRAALPREDGYRVFANGGPAVARAAGTPTHLVVSS